MRRTLLRLFPFVSALGVLFVCLPRPARAFGDVGAFDPRALMAGGTTGPARASAGARWSWELVQRTSAPARLKPTQVRASDPGVVDAPFLWWSGDIALSPLSPQEIAGLRRFFALGGVLLVDDAGAPEDSSSEGRSSSSAFGRSAREQIARILPDASPIALEPDHVLFKSYYLLKRAEGRVAGPRTLDAIVRGGRTQVIFSSHDIGGALARGATGSWEYPVIPGGDLQRERAIRLAVNVAMYVLCSNYKDDQVHAPFLMRRRAGTLLP
ncbi:MAG TPA: DUF4159 domain-containing protein [Labilithrix sp.]|nr:DUF4159 domain-containing protein [Labilithrix sp.]